MKLANYLLFALQQDPDFIKDKIENAPDKAYEIGIFIGTFLPLVLLIGFAYFLFRYFKNRND